MAGALTFTLMFTACIGAGVQGELVLEGPAKVEVDRLGPVMGPVAIVEGEETAKVDISVEPESVAHIRDGELHAVGPGEAVVRAQWNDQEVQWTLVVEPMMMLALVDPPAGLAVGQKQTLSVKGMSGETAVDPGPVNWSSSQTAIATVSATGEVTAVAPGRTYISVSTGEVEAMLELEVTP